MPLLRRTQFTPNQPPDDLRRTEEVFRCRYTNELFRNYEAYFNRTILCNSMVWTCEYTGRSNLTYKEALKSEEAARANLNTFPEVLQRQILLLVGNIKRSRTTELIDEILIRIRDCYFPGEVVEITRNENKVFGEIVNAILPDNLPMANKISISIAESQSPSSKINAERTPNGKSRRESVTVIDLVADKEQSSSSNVVNDDNEKMKAKAEITERNARYIYEIRLTDDDTVMTSNASAISRKKGILTKDKLRHFLKFACRRTSEKHPYYVKNEFIKKFNFPESFKEKRKPEKRQSLTPTLSKNGPFSASSKTGEKGSRKAKEPKGKKKLNLNKQTPAMSKSELKALRKQHKEEEKKRLAEDKARRKLELVEERKKRKQLAEEAKLERKLERKRERDRLRREKLLQAQRMEEWSRPRDDLELDDLQALPTPCSITKLIDNSLFGKAIMVLEFLNSFDEVFSASESLPMPITFENLEKALHSSEVDGLFSDLIQFLLGDLIKAYHEAEDEEKEIKLDGIQKVVSPPGEKEDADTVDTSGTSIDGNIGYGWSRLTQGIPFREIKVDCYTCSELLRLHLLSSCKLATGDARYRWQKRGGYMPSDDPATELIRKNPDLLNKLTVGNLYDLEPKDKLEILEVLCGQLLTLVSVRDYLDECMLKYRELRHNLKEDQWAEQRRIRKEAAKQRKKTESKLKTNSDKPDGNQSNKEETHSDDADSTANKNDDEDEENEMSEEECDTSEDEEDREERRERIKETMQEITDIASTINLRPLGRDRSYRRYWIFKTFPGLVVEDDERENGTAEIHEITTKVNDIQSMEMEKEVVTNDNGTRDLKGEAENSPNQSQELAVIDNSSNINNNKHLDNHEIVKNENLKSEIVSPVLNLSIEPYYENGKQLYWAYYKTTEDLDKLIDALNPRGHRERALKKILQREYVSLQAILESSSESRITTESKKSRLSHVQEENVDAESFMLDALREELLDLECRLWEGGLGGIESDWRDEWREKMENIEFSDLMKSNLNGNHCNRLKDDSITNECSDSGIQSEKPSPNTSGNRLSNGGINLTTSNVDLGSSENINVNPVIKQLAEGLQQIEASIQRKYLKPPLGIDPKKVKKDNESRHDDGSDCDSTEEDRNVPRKTNLERWQESLSSTINLSQIFIYLGTLDKSVIWSRSILNARCRICRRKGDAELMLLCDECDRGHHTYCLRPPLNSIPAGNWYCPDCKPRKQVRKQRSAKAKNVSYHESESEDAVESEDDDDDDDDDGNDESEEEEEEEEDDEEEEEEEEEDDEEEEEELEDDDGDSEESEELSDEYQESLDDEEELSKSVTTRSKRNLRSRSRNEPQRKRTRRSGSVSSSNSSNQRYNFRRKKEKENQNPVCRSGIKRPGTATRDNRLTIEFKKCDDLIKDLEGHRDSWPFLQPVDKNKVPDYYNIVKKPMDFNTIKKKLNSLSYKDSREFATDVRLVFINCAEYNSPRSKEARAGNRLSMFYETKLTELGLDKAYTPDEYYKSTSKRRRKY